MFHLKIFPGDRPEQSYLPYYLQSQDIQSQKITSKMISSNAQIIICKSINICFWKFCQLWSWLPKYPTPKIHIKTHILKILSYFTREYFHICSATSRSRSRRLNFGIFQSNEVFRWRQEWKRHTFGADYKQKRSWCQVIQFWLVNFPAMWSPQTLALFLPLALGGIVFHIRLT